VQPVETGGLDIKDIECFNVTLLAKWKWRYSLSGEGLCREVLDVRYGNWRNMDVTLTKKVHSTWWQDVCRISDKDALGNWFDHRCQWRLGDGSRVKFWKDRWVDDQVLKEKFSRLFMISQCSESVVGDIVHRENITSEGCSRWCLGWRRERFVWEKQEEEQMMALISNVHWCIST